MAQISCSMDGRHCSELKFCLKTESVESVRSVGWKVNMSVSSSEKGVVYPTSSCWISSFLIQEKAASSAPLMCLCVVGLILIHIL